MVVVLPSLVLLPAAPCVSGLIKIVMSVYSKRHVAQTASLCLLQTLSPLADASVDNALYGAHRSD